MKIIIIYSFFHFGERLDLPVRRAFLWSQLDGLSHGEIAQRLQVSITNLLARYDISKNLSASVNLNNLFDREYYNFAGYTGNYGAPRNLMTSFKYNF